MLVCFRRFIGGIAILAACLLAIPTSADMQLYTVADLGTLPGTTMGFTTSMSVSDINDAGDVVGCAGMFVEPVFGHEVWRPFVYTNGEMRQLTDRLRSRTASTIRVRRLDSRPLAPTRCQRPSCTRTAC